MNTSSPDKSAHQLPIALYFSLAALAVLVVSAWGDSAPEDYAQEVEAQVANGWLEGKIAGAYLFNQSLSPLDIRILVDGDIATLSGVTESEVQKNLAQEVALSIDGIAKVDNQLEVDPAREPKDDASDEVVEVLTDGAITAAVKTKLLANSNVPGTRISIDTDDGKVTLSGTVPSPDQKQLIYYVTHNTDGVQSIDNRITVDEDA